MPRLFVATCVLLPLALFAQQTNRKGVHPRATPEDYMVNATSGSTTFAASLVSQDQAKHLFAIDISQKYLVFEVAVFPDAATNTEVAADDFVIKRADKGDLAHPSDGATVALNVQKENMPNERGRSTDVITEANIGYQSGVDPVTGQRVHGVSYGGGAAVEHGGSRPPDDPRPGGTYQDRELLQRQLEDRALPAGKFDHPVAGYLYFPKSLAKKDSNGNFVLQHLGDPDSHGAIASLQIPAKNR